jgi:serine protease
MRLRPLVAAALALVVAAPALAERTPSRAQPLADAAASARVIVKLREQSSVLRAHALSAAATPAAQHDVMAARASALGQRLGLTLHAGSALDARVQVVQARGLSSQQLAARLAVDPDVEAVEPDRRMRRVALTDDPRLTSVSGAQGPAVGQWYLRAPAGDVRSAINAVAAWDAHTGNPAVVVAVLDTGVRSNHPDLAGKLLPGYDMVDDAQIGNDGSRRDADPSDPGDWVSQGDIDGDPALYEGCEVADSSWHGTQVAGIVAAATNNGVGMAGSGRHVRILPVRVLGKCFGYTSDIVAAMRWAAGLSVPGVPANPTPARVINLSLGSGGACSQSEADAIAAVNAAGAVVVAAAGNSAGGATGSPANCTGAIGVVGLRHVGTKVGFSDLGPEIKIAAPGGNCVNVDADQPCLYPILTTINGGATTPGTSGYSDSFNISVGTSFSAPLVSGTAALLYSVRPSIAPLQVLAALQSSARPFPSSGLPDDPFAGPIATCQAPGASDQLQCYCTTTTCGAGMLDADGAVRAVLGATQDALQPVITLQGAAPEAGVALTLASGNSIVPAGRVIAARRWTLIDSGNGAVPSLGGTVDGDTLTITPAGGGRVTVQLALTDERGLVTASDLRLDIAGAPAPGAPAPNATPPATPSSSGDGGGGGGGALSGGWLVALALATLALARRPGMGTARRPRAARHR